VASAPGAAKSCQQARVPDAPPPKGFLLQQTPAANQGRNPFADARPDPAGSCGSPLQRLMKASRILHAHPAVRNVIGRTGCATNQRLLVPARGWWQGRGRASNQGGQKRWQAARPALWATPSWAGAMPRMLFCSLPVIENWRIRESRCSRIAAWAWRPRSRTRDRSK